MIWRVCPINIETMPRYAAGRTAAGGIIKGVSSSGTNKRFTVNKARNCRQVTAFGLTVPESFPVTAI